MLAWRVFQLADSAFPAGGFAHSAGLEAATQLGEVTTAEDVRAFLASSLWQVGMQALPFVGAAHDGQASDDALDALLRLDAKHDALLTSHVANRASRTQGRAFVATCSRIFDDPRLLALHDAVRAKKLAAHFAPVFGATVAILGVSRRDALAVHLHLALRAVASAAVRLGIVGPHEAQRLQDLHAPTLDAVLVACEGIAPDDAAQPAPLLDLFGSVQDRLYSRLFQS